MSTTPAEDLQALRIVSAAAGLAATIPQYAVNAPFGPSTGVMQLSAIWLPQGTVVTNIVVISGATAAGTNTHFWVALYRLATNDTAAATQLTLMAQSTDDTGASTPAANTKVTKALTTAQTCPYTGMYYIGLNQTATTPASWLAAVGPAANIVNNDAPILAATSTTGLTATAPATPAALAGMINRLYAYVT